MPSLGACVMEQSVLSTEASGLDSLTTTLDNLKHTFSKPAILDHCDNPTKSQRVLCWAHR